MFSLKPFFIVCCLLLVGGCSGIPLSVGTESVNTGLFKNPAELHKLISSLDRGISEREVLDKLGLNSETANIELLGEKMLYSLIFAGAQVQGTPKEIEAFREELQLHQYSAWSLLYRSLKRAGYVENVTHVATEQSGYDLRVVCIFEKGRLYKKCGVYGRSKVATKSSSSYIWNLLSTVPSRAAGIAF